MHLRALDRGIYFLVCNISTISDYINSICCTHLHFPGHEGIEFITLFYGLMCIQKCNNVFICLCMHVCVDGIEPRALHMLGKHSATELYPSDPNDGFYLRGVIRTQWGSKEGGILHKLGKNLEKV
jgi:hypothetical protein